MIKLKPLYEVDDWGRPLYKDDDNNYYCDVNLGTRGSPIHMCFKGGKHSEPDFSVINYKIEE